MGIFSSSAKGINPMSSGGTKNGRSGGKSPHPLGRNLSESKNAATRALAQKSGLPKMAGKISMPIHGVSAGTNY